MKHVGVAVAMIVIVVAGFACAAKDKTGTKAKPVTVRGVVESNVNGVLKMTPRARKAVQATTDQADKTVIVVTDTNTKVTIDGQAAALSDISKGMNIVVTPAEGTATKIEISTKTTTTKAKNKNKNGKAAKGANTAKAGGRPPDPA